mmetsp:Transcript_113787/g.220845  ORF Transcript_113787/g.220845 Transcript_113787/m.220845 type:complete len:344 (-) Transcript_113787:303-1334(-)
MADDSSAHMHLWQFERVPVKLDVLCTVSHRYADGRRCRSHHYLIRKFICRILRTRVGNNAGSIIAAFVGTHIRLSHRSQLTFPGSARRILGLLNSTMVHAAHAAQFGSCIVADTSYVRMREHRGSWQPMPADVSSWIHSEYTMGGSLPRAQAIDLAITAQTLVAWGALEPHLSHGDGCVVCLAPHGIAGCCGQLMAKLVAGLNLQGTGKLRTLCRSFNSYGMGGRLDTMQRCGCSFRVPANYHPLQFNHALRCFRHPNSIKDRGSFTRDSGIIDICNITLLCILFPEAAERHDGWHWEDVICALAPGTKVFVWSGRLDADLRAKLIELIPEVTFITHSADGVW